MSDLQDEVGDNEKVTFFVTIRYKYETTGADLEKYYDTRDLKTCAEIDRKNFQDYPEFFAEDIQQNGRPFEVRVNASRLND